ncbi:hypothetical protein ACFC26_22090 [Kitasatospora purpeofusca]|uniref:hypothetical protein n=1 Tax=Kitasatospora purpeofusca TaxID=67352 RepID=UPI0035DC308E
MNQAGRPRVLLPVLGAALLVAIALALLAPGSGTARPSGARAQSSTTAPSPAAPSPTTVPPAATPTGTPTASAPTMSEAGAPAAGPSATEASTAVQAPPSGAPAAADGPAADPRIEADFQATHPSDLSAEDAAQVRALTVQVWKAETTGEGRERWPLYFPATSAPLRPYIGVRVQAVSAHTVDGRVIVELLWAGAGPAGEFQDQRHGAIAVARTSAGWEPVR